MAEQMTWGLYGHGLIGSELKRQLCDPEVARRMHLSPFPEFVVRRSGVFDANMNLLDVKDPEDLEIPDVIFVAINSFDSGEEAMKIMRPALNQGKMVVTAEKGGLANNFAELRDISEYFERLGIRATVGGGTRMIHLLREYCIDVPNVAEIHAVLNGTLTAIYSLCGPRTGSSTATALEINEEYTLAAAVGSAIENGFAEPGGGTPQDVVRAEAVGDIPKKVSILFNAAELGDTVLDWKQMAFSLSDAEIDQSIAEASNRRFIVSMIHDSHGKLPDTDIIGGFDIMHDGWRIVGGFQHIDHNPSLLPLADLTDAGNGVFVGLGKDSRDGKYIPGGPGAGPEPTVNAMLDDVLIRTSGRNNPYL